MEDAVKERTDHGMGQGSSVRDFHSELMILRRRWRLKRTGTSIMGDLTYRSGKMTQIIFRIGMINRYSLCLGGKSVPYKRQVLGQKPDGNHCLTRNGRKQQ